MKKNTENSGELDGSQVQDQQCSGVITYSYHRDCGENDYLVSFNSPFGNLSDLRVHGHPEMIDDMALIRVANCLSNSAKYDIHKVSKKLKKKNIKVRDLSKFERYTRYLLTYDGNHGHLETGIGDSDSICNLLRILEMKYISPSEIHDYIDKYCSKSSSYESFDSVTYDLVNEFDVLKIYISWPDFCNSVTILLSLHGITIDSFVIEQLP